MQAEISVNNRGKVLLRNHDDYAELSINNGPQNIVDIEVIQDLITAFSMLQPGISFILIRAEGPNFSLGFDTSCVRVKETGFMKEIQDLAFALRRMIESIDKPVYAALHGFCLGLGFEIALSCDHIYAGADAKFGFPDSRFGLPPLTGIMDRLDMEYGYTLVDLILSGEIIGADDPRSRLFATTVGESDYLNSSLMEIEASDSSLRSYYKGLRKMNAGNPDSHIFSILSPERIRLKELEAFRNNL